MALILLPIRNERLGGTAGPSYTTTASIKARNRCRAWLEETFTIAEPADAADQSDQSDLPI